MNIQVFQILTVNIFILLLITLIIFLKMLMLYNSSVHLISQIIKIFLKKDSVFCCLFIFFIFLWPSCSLQDLSAPSSD